MCRGTGLVYHVSCRHTRVSLSVRRIPQMRLIAQPSGYRSVIPDMALVCVLVLTWESIATPSVSTSPNPWQGIWLSLLTLLAAAYRMAARPGASSRFFVFGVFGSLLFVQRFRHRGCFGYPDPPLSVVGCYLLFFAIGLGSACWLVAKVKELSITPKSDHKSTS